MTAYYNEIDPYAAQWLRNLIEAGHIAPGVVDERSIENVKPEELSGYTQCHFFAGIGVWSLALRQAGWPDDRPVWTGSCPCQPFSSAGTGAGFDDERHLWPSFHWLIQQCRPPVVFGEQVASKVVDTWIDLVHADLEALGYTFGGVPFPSAGVGAPHIRDRLFWVGHTNDAGLERYSWNGGVERWQGAHRPVTATGVPGRMAHTHDPRLQGGERIGETGAQGASCGHDTERRSAGGMADTTDIRLNGRRSGEASDGGDSSRIEPERLCDAGEEPAGGPTNGFWRAADWLLCRDAKWRSVEPGTFPLAHGASSRVGRLRAYGNAINAQAAKVFIEAYLQ